MAVIKTSKSLAISEEHQAQIIALISEFITANMGGINACKANYTPVCLMWNIWRKAVSWEFHKELYTYVNDDHIQTLLMRIHRSLIAAK